MALPVSIYARGTLASRPAAATHLEGIQYLQTDNTPGVYRCSGSAWDLVAFSYTEDITPATIVANQNDYNPTGLSGAVVVRLSSDASRNITGLVGGTDGRVLTLINVGAQNIVLQSENVGSTAGNRFLLQADITLGANAACVLIYDATSSRWRASATTTTGSGTPSGAAGGDLAGTYPNPTVALASQAFAMPGDISPPQITANQNDYNPSGLSTASVLRLTTDASRNITGLAGGADGRIIRIINVGSFNIVLQSENVGSLAANRFSFQADITLVAGAATVLWYDSTSSRWRSTAVTTTGSGAPSGSAGGDLAGTYPNPTVAQASQAFARTGDISPAQITANQNDYNPASLSTSSVLRLSSDASRNITGLAGGADGRMIDILNIGSFNIVLKNEDAGSTAANRFAISSDMTIQSGSGCSLIYDSTSSRWRAVGLSSSGTGAPSGTAGGDLSGAYPNPTVAQASQAFAMTGDITPTQIVANQNDYNPTGLSTSSVLRLSTDASRNITGLAGGADGRVVTIINVGSFNIVLQSENASSSAANRFSLEADITIASKAARVLIYDSTASRWRCIGVGNTGTGAPSGAAGGDLAGSYPNPTVAKASESFAFTGDISPTQITANQNDYNPTGLSTATVLRLSTDASRNITGLAGGADGRVITIVNVGSFNIVLQSENAGSTAANRFAFETDITMAPNASAVLIYDSTSSRWRNIGVSRGASAGPTGAAGGDLGGSYPNPTVAKASESFALSGDISPAQIVANQNDYNPASLSTSSVLRLSSDASRNITGLAGGADGRVLTLINIGSFNNIVLKTEDIGSLAANRFLLEADITIGPAASCVLIYDSTSSRWRSIAVTRGAAGAPSGAASGDLAGVYPNPTVAQASQAFALTGDISPTQITTDQNDYNPASLSTATVLRLDTNGTRNITGLAGGADGRVIALVNISSFTITLPAESASSSAANRFGFETDLVLAGNAACLLIYDSTSSRWRQTGASRSKVAAAIKLAIGDEITAVTAGTAKFIFRMPFAMTLTEVRAELATAQASGSIFTVDINEAGITILSTKLTIDNTEKTSVSAATPPVISDSALADDAEMSIDVDQVGDGTAKGLKVTLIGNRT